MIVKKYTILYPIIDIIGILMVLFQIFLSVFFSMQHIIKDFSFNYHKHTLLYFSSYFNNNIRFYSPNKQSEPISQYNVSQLRELLKLHGAARGTSKFRKAELLLRLQDILTNKEYKNPIIYNISKQDITKNKKNKSNEILSIYTDGCCFRNGMIGSKGGIGVYFGDNDKRNISEPLSGSCQTNQRAEIVAAIRALQSVSKDIKVIIKTDSKYVINAMNTWIHNWKTNNYVNVKNSDLFKELDNLVESFSYPPEFIYVKAHSGIKGNEKADILAKEGAKEGERQNP